MTESDDVIAAQVKALAAPFEEGLVKYRAGAVSKDGTRALALAYVDARVVMARLDEVMGVQAWSDHYDFLPDGTCVCTLSLRLGTEWVSKMDVGGQSEQPDEGDRRKASVSEALKRAAVKFGVARYLYSLPNQWVDYDKNKKQLVMPQSRQARPQAKATPTRTQVPAPRPLPATGQELLARLLEHDGKLVAKGLCEAGQLVRHVQMMGRGAGHPDRIEEWGKQAIEAAVEETRIFQSQRRQQDRR